MVEIYLDSEYWNYNIDSLTNDIIAEINFIKTETKSGKSIAPGVIMKI